MASINGFTACNPSQIGYYKVPGTKNVVLGVRREIAPLLIGFAADFNRLVEPLDGKTKDDWGYACRVVRGRATISFHAPGIAIDLNALRHPMGVANTFSPRQRTIIRALAKKYGLRWGGDYSGRKDDMHLEVILPRAQALALVKKIQKPKKKANKRVTGAFPLKKNHYFGKAKKGTKRDHNGDKKKDKKYIKMIQREVGVKVTGHWNKATTRGVKRYQTWFGLKATGRVNKNTWATMRKN